MGGKQRIFVERGQKYVFAGAIDWPGWIRRGRSEDEALQTLLDYAPRYASAIKRARVGFKSPAKVTELDVVEVVKGNAATDFGAQNVPLAIDLEPFDEAELRRQIKLLEACWQAFDEAVQAARGKKLTTGPRGGGRDVPRMRRHVIESDVSSLSGLGGKSKFEAGSPAAVEARLRDLITETLFGRTRGEVPGVGPRGGKRWTPRYVIRRSASHALDHAWELEDRAGPS